MKALLILSFCLEFGLLFCFFSFVQSSDTEQRCIRNQKKEMREAERELTVLLCGTEAVALFEIDGGVSPRAL